MQPTVDRSKERHHWGELLLYRCRLDQFVEFALSSHRTSTTCAPFDRLSNLLETPSDSRAKHLTASTDAYHPSTPTRSVLCSCVRCRSKRSSTSFQRPHPTQSKRVSCRRTTSCRTTYWRDFLRRWFDKSPNKCYDQSSRRQYVRRTLAV